MSLLMCLFVNTSSCLCVKEMFLFLSIILRFVALDVWLNQQWKWPGRQSKKDELHDNFKDICSGAKRKKEEKKKGLDTEGVLPGLRQVQIWCRFAAWQGRQRVDVNAGM